MLHSAAPPINCSSVPGGWLPILGLQRGSLRQLSSVLVLLHLNSSSCPDCFSTGKLVIVSDLNTCV